MAYCVYSLQRQLNGLKAHLNMPKRKVFWIILYLGLLGLTLDFCLDNFKAYLSARTYYTPSQQPITLFDLPTLTVCWNVPKKHFDKMMILGTDLTIDLKVFEKEQQTVTLVENEYVRSQFNLDIHLSELYPIRRSVVQALCSKSDVSDQFNRMQCYKISSKWNGHGKVDFRRFGMQLRFNILNPQLQSFSHLFSPHVIFTTEENAYGAVGERWFDGKPICAKHIQPSALLHILGVTQYVKMGTCSSYSEKLAERFVMFDFRQKVVRNGKEIQCPNEEICFPISLPFKNNNISLCHNETHRSCYHEIIEHLKLDHEKHCKKTQNGKEFEIEWLNQGRNTTNDLKPNSKFRIIEYKFSVPLFILDHRSEEPFKTVMTEYYVTTGLSLVGNIGGTLGMFIGFSFLGTAEWLLNVAETVIKGLKKIT